MLTFAAAAPTLQAPRPMSPRVNAAEATTARIVARRAASRRRPKGQLAVSRETIAGCLFMACEYVYPRLRQLDELVAGIDLSRAHPALAECLANQRAKLLAVC